MMHHYSFQNSNNIVIAVYYKHKSDILLFIHIFGVHKNIANFCVFIFHMYTLFIYSEMFCVQLFRLQYYHYSINIQL